MALLKRNVPGFKNLSDFFGEDWFNFQTNDLLPAINVSESDDNYEVELAVPGFKKEDFNAVVENGILTVTAKSEREEEEKNKNYTRKEFSSKSFSRSFTLPDNIDENNIEAHYNEGVLKLILNKSEQVLPSKRSLDIK
jgi:HSP20 family protein